MKILQVGLGSGGMVVLDLLCRDQRISQFTLIDPDVYKPHNSARHYFPASASGTMKVDLAKQWVQSHRPDIAISTLNIDITESSEQAKLHSLVAESDLCVCAVDVEPAKYHFDSLMRAHQKTWTLGEVLSGGIGGFVHGFLPGRACYGCVASFLKRDVATEKPSTPDYSQPGGAVHEVTIPATIQSIHLIASLHAELTLRMLDPGFEPDFTSLLLTLMVVPDVFPEALKAHRFGIKRDPACLLCSPDDETTSPEERDAAFENALARLGGK